MRLSHRFSFILICAILLQSIAPLVPSVKAKASLASRALPQPSAVAHHVDKSWINPAPLASANVSIPSNDSFLPVIYKTGLVQSAFTSITRPGTLPQLPANQVITGTEDTLFLVNGRQFGRTDNFSIVSPTWAITATLPFTMYDFILDPEDPYRTAWIAADNGIWRMTNLNSSSAISWTQVRSMAQITAEISTLTTTFPIFSGVARIASDVSRPNYFFVVLASSTGDNSITWPSGWVGWTTDGGNNWSWQKLPQSIYPQPLQGLGTKGTTGGASGLAVSQDGSGRIWLTGYGFSGQPFCGGYGSHVVFSEDYGQHWRVIWNSARCQGDYPHALYYARGKLFVSDGNQTVGKLVDTGTTYWTFITLTAPLKTSPNLNNALEGIPQTDQLIHYVDTNGRVQYSTSGGDTFITRTQIFTGSDKASGLSTWIDAPNRMAASQLLKSVQPSTLILRYSPDGGVSWQNKTGDWYTAFNNLWAGATATSGHDGNAYILIPSQVDYLRRLAQHGKLSECALGCDTLHWANDPIDTSSGNLSYQVTDLSVTSLGGNLSFQRSYASAGSSVSGTLGYGWVNNFDTRLLVPAALTHPLTVALQTANGSQLQFFRIVSDTALGTYAPDLGVTAALTRVVSSGLVTYTLVDKNQTTYTFNLNGTLLSKRDAFNHLTTYSYTSPNTLTQVTDVGTGRWLQFTYAQGQLKTVFDNSGRTIAFTYSNGDLTSLLDTRGLTWTYVYTGSHLLWKVLDPDNRTVIRTEYDAQGRAVEQYNGLSLRTIRLDFSADGKTILTDARGITSTDTYVRGAWTGGLDANSKPITRSYDLNFRSTTIADANGNAIQMQWSPNGHNLEKITYAPEISITQKFDTLNNLTRTVDARGFATVFTYTGSFLTGKIDALGNTWLYTPTNGGLNLLSQAQDAKGNLTGYGYDSLGQRVVMTEALGNVTRYGYDPIGRLISMTVNADQPAYERTTLNRYDGAGNLISTTVNFNPAANADLHLYNLTTLYAYDGAGRQIAITDTIGRVTRNFYNDAGQLISTTANFTDTPGVDPNLYNLTTRYGYDQVGNRILVTDTRHLVTKTEFDNLNRPITVTTNYENGLYNVAVPDQDLIHVAHYDPVGNVIEQIEMSANGALDRVTRTWYDNLNRPITVTRNYNALLPANHNSEYNLTTVTSYDAAGNAIQSLDPLGHPAWFRYDALNRLISATNALSGTTLTQYDAVGNRVLVTDVLGRATRYEYDQLNRLITTTFPLTGWVVNTYDPVGNRTRVTDALRHGSVYTYNLRGQLIAEMDALGGTTRYEYDRIGNRVAMTDANGIVTCYTYDIQSRLLSVTENYSLTGPIDNQTNITTSYGYDQVGNRTVMTNARGFTTTYTYDALSRLIAVRDPLSHTVKYQYDALGNRAVMTDANRNVTLYGYDKVSRLRVITYTAEAKTVRYAYDALGNRLVMTDSLGVTRYRYDDLNHLKQVTDPFSQTTTYTYDLAGNRTGLKYPDGKIVTYTFDANNRLTRTLSWDGQATAYFYDRVGRLITTTWPNGVSTLYSYDDAGRLLNMTHVGHWILAAYTYTLDALGNRLAVQERILPPTPLTYLPLMSKDDSGGASAPSGQTTPFDSPLPLPAPFQSPLTPTSSVPPYSAAAPLFDSSLLIIAPLALAAVVANKKGRKWALLVAVLTGVLVIVGQTQTSGAMPAPKPFLSPQSPPPGCTLPNAIDETRVISYTYDPLYHLSQAAYSSGECYQYDYDRVGNRTIMTTTLGTTAYQYDLANRLSSVNSQAYTWDDNGNLINDGTALYRYDQANRLISTTLNSTTSLLNYNGDGARLKQIVAGVVATYTQDFATPLPVVLQAKRGSATTQYLYALGTRPLAQNDGAWEYLMPDVLGSVRQIADASGNVILTQDYEPYGKILYSSGSDRGVYGFTGEEWDPSGLIYLRARYMNPMLGIFLTEDTAPGIASLPLSMHPYLYAWANSINRIDPSGLQQPPPRCNFGDICSSGPTEPYVGTTPWTPPLPPYPAWQYYNEINSKAHEFHIPPIVLAGALNNQAVSPYRPLEPLFVWWYARLGTEMGFPHSYGIAQIRLYEIPDLIGHPGPMDNYSENAEILCRLVTDDRWGIELMARKLAIVQGTYLAGRCGDDGCQPGEYNESELYALLALAQNTGPREGASIAQAILRGEPMERMLSGDSPRTQMVGMYGQYVGLSNGDPILYPSYKWDLPNGVADAILQLLQDTDPNQPRSK